MLFSFGDFHSATSPAKTAELKTTNQSSTLIIYLILFGNGHKFSMVLRPDKHFSLISMSHQNFPASWRHHVLSWSKFPISSFQNCRYHKLILMQYEFLFIWEIMNLKSFPPSRIIPHTHMVNQKLEINKGKCLNQILAAWCNLYVSIINPVSSCEFGNLLAELAQGSLRKLTDWSYTHYPLHDF